MFKKIVLTGISAFFSLNVAAGESLYETELPLVWGSIITVSGGPSWGTAGQNLYLYPNPIPRYNYLTYDSPTSTMANGELFFGLQRMVNPYIMGQLGLGVAGVSDAKVTGQINVDGVPNVYDYQYKVSHTRLDLKGKLIAYNCTPVQPYVSGSIGAGFNDSHDYSAYSLVPALYPTTPWFSTNTTVAFAYTLGLGVQATITPKWQVGIGYEWGDLGKSYLNGDDSIYFGGPELTHFYNNQLLFSLSYLFS